MTARVKPCCCKCGGEPAIGLVTEGGVLCQSCARQLTESLRFGSLLHAGLEARGRGATNDVLDRSLKEIATLRAENEALQQREQQRQQRLDYVTGALCRALCALDISVPLPGEAAKYKGADAWAFRAGWAKSEIQAALAELRR